MRTSTAVLDLEISSKFPEFNTIGEYAGALVLFRLHGRPLGWGAASLTEGGLDRGALVRQLLEQHAWSCALPLAERAVLSGIPPRALDITALLNMPPQPVCTGPLVTVAVCSRTPAAQLRPCLDSLLTLDYAPIDLVLIDASEDRAQVEALVRESYPAIRYFSAPASGGSAVRRAVSECRGDILALTHGDGMVEKRWVSRIAAVFLADPDVMAVSGLVLPRSIERPIRAGLPAGAPFCRQWSRTAGDLGSMQKMIERGGANTAFWRPGSSTAAPFTHVFEPSAIVHVSSSPVTPSSPRRVVSVTHATRAVDLATGICPIADAMDDDSINLHVTWSGAHIGDAHIEHRGGVVSPLWIADAVAQQLTVEVLDARLGVGEHVCRALLTADLARHVVTRCGHIRDAGGKSPKRPAAAA